MTTPPIMSVTDELIAELEAAANAATPQNLDSAEDIIKADPCVMIECPICHGEGYASHENDYCNFDNHAIGVQFYGIGTEFGAGERYFRAANPSTILALLSERAELKRKVGGLNASRIAYASEFPLKSDGEPDTGSIHANIRKLKRDAERYRWLRDGESSEFLSFYALGFPHDQLDAAIDAAMTP